MMKVHRKSSKWARPMDSVPVNPQLNGHSTVAKLAKATSSLQLAGFGAGRVGFHAEDALLC